jgi:outer membrane protein assembly factor BamB
VNKAGKLSWQRKFDGVRKGYAYNASNLLQLINESVDGTSATLSALDGSTGVERFTLNVPKSYEQEVNIRRSGDRLLCVPGGNFSRPLHTVTSGLFVSTDGNAYASFVQKQWRVETKKCEAGATIRAETVSFSRDDQLVLWQIHPDGSLRKSIVETSRQPRLSLTSHFRVPSPTGSIIPDGFDGVLFSVRSSPTSAAGGSEGPSDDSVYRVTEDGELAYKFPLPTYTGTLHDEMVLGEQELGFATRGGMLIAFNVRDGKEVWRWDSGKAEIEVNMATAGGGCIVSTPDGLVLVEDGVKNQVLAPRGSDMYTPGRFIQDDPHGFGMLGPGVVKH